MKSPNYKQEESAMAIAQRLLNKKKFIAENFSALTTNKTAQDRRLNEFGKVEEKKDGRHN